MPAARLPGQERQRSRSEPLVLLDETSSVAMPWRPSRQRLQNRESRYLRHQGRCLGDNRQASLSGHEGGSRHAWRRGAAWSAPRPWAAPDCEGCRGPVQDGGSSWPVPVYHFRCDVGRGDLPESNPAPPGPQWSHRPRGRARHRSGWHRVCALSAIKAPTSPRGFFRSELERLGSSEGKNVHIDYR
jgi:hypothetical protein